MIIAAPSGLIGALEHWRARWWPEPPETPPAPLAMKLADARVAEAGKLLALTGIAKSFGGVRALDAVDLTVEAGEIVGLIGPNGSGKTTLVNVVTGVYAPDGGSVRLAGADITGHAVHAIARTGIARTFQNLNLVDDMSVIDSVAVARLAPSRSGLLRAITAPPRDPHLARARGEAMALLERLGIARNAMRPLGGLGPRLKRPGRDARPPAL